MPFIIDTGGSQFISGMKRQTIIDTANRRTGKIAEGLLNLNGEFLSAMQDFCLERSWWWRKKTVTLDTVEDVAVYDMADPESPINALDCVRMSVLAYYPVNDNRKIVHPLFDDKDIHDAMESDERGEPCNYFFVPGSTTAIQLVPRPDKVYHLRAGFWACPNGTIDTLEDRIPLIPAYLHHLLETKLEIAILTAPVVLKQFGAAALQAVAAKYDLQFAAALRQQHWADGKQEQYTETDEAIRSEF